MRFQNAWIYASERRDFCGRGGACQGRAFSWRGQAGFLNLRYHFNGFVLDTSRRELRRGAGWTAGMPE
jgi:hypothetical protein